jgi:chorismate mutase
MSLIRARKGDHIKFMPIIIPSWAAIVLACAGCAGCAGDGRVSASRMLTPDDFASTAREARNDQGGSLSRRLDAQAIAQASGMPELEDPVMQARARRLDAPAIADAGPNPAGSPRARDPVLNITAEVGKVPVSGASAVSAADGSPSEPASEATDSVWPAKVGEINGRPIYSDRVLEPMIDRLRAEAREPRVTRETWRRSAREQIKLALERQQVADLLAAEGRASLKEGQQQGLRAFITERYAEEQRQARGSQELRARVLANEGLTEQQWLRREEDEVLMRQQMNELLDRRVRVTWPEIQIAYERDRERFNPPPKAKLRLISVDADDAAAVGEIQASLDAGRPFGEVAGDERNTSFRREGGLMPEEQTLDGETFDDAKLNEAAASLKALEWTRQPVQIESKVGGKTRREAVWIFVESLRSLSLPLTDPKVQLEITKELTKQKRDQELDRQILRLRNRAGVEGQQELDAITDRLLKVVSDDVWPQADAPAQAKPATPR